MTNKENDPAPDEKAEVQQSDTENTNPTPQTEAQPSSAEQIAKLEDDLLRARAETQNTIKRLSAEINRAEDSAIASIMGGLLDIIDGLERALEFKSKDHKAVLDGVAMTLAQFKDALSKNGIETIEPEPGDRLDPHLHQAISYEENTTIAKNRIVRIFMKGYRNRSNLMRPASVVVSSSQTKDQSQSQPSQDTES